MYKKIEIENWFIDRGLQACDPEKQKLKLVEEIGEIASGMCRGNKELIMDGIGDVYVVLIGLSLQLRNYTFRDDCYINSKTLPQLIMKLLVDCENTASYKMSPYYVVEELIRICDIDCTPEECIDMAYNQIKDRTGNVVGGVYVKEE
jgi:hypothetical protein